MTSRAHVQTRHRYAAPVAAVLGLAVLTGCGGSEDPGSSGPPTASPTDPGSSEGGTPLPEADPGGTVAPAAPEGDPLQLDPLFAATPDRVPCLQGGDGSYLAWTLLTTDRRLRLADVELDGTRSEVVRAWVATPPSGASPEPGVVVGSAPPQPRQQDLGWRERAPLADAALVPDQLYVLFLRTRLQSGAEVDGYTVTWDDGDGTGRSEAADPFTLQRTCNQP